MTPIERLHHARAYMTPTFKFPIIFDDLHDAFPFTQHTSSSLWAAKSRQAQPVLCVPRHSSCAEPRSPKILAHRPKFQSQDLSQRLQTATRQTTLPHIRRAVIHL
jgi:hypothetical protein